MISQSDFAKLKSIPLVDVMRANGYEPVRMPKGDGRVKYLCPFHSETDGSFCVDQHPYGDAEDCCWKCYGKCAITGYGAIALQAALMGYDHSSRLSDKQFKAVVQRLVDDHGVKIEGVAPTSDAERTEVISPQECEFDLAPWTVEHLRALGFAVKLATEQDGEELVVKYKESEPLYRCSLDREFWRGRGEAKTAQEWGEIIER